MRIRRLLYTQGNNYAKCAIVSPLCAYVTLYCLYGLFIDPMLGYWWAIVSDAGPPITQHWVNVSILYMGRNLLPRALKYENNDIHAAEKPGSRKHAAFT